ncbi:MAG: hypothetical protein Q9182_006083 [Xanthomendoza sp. 2 TL-2023]
MSQVATKSFRNTTLSAGAWRNKDPVLRPRIAEPSTGPSSPSATWRISAIRDGNPSAQPSQTVPSILEEEDGFTTVSNAKSNRQRGYNDLRAPDSTRGESYRPSSRLNPPSAAAISRAASYTPYQRPSTYSRSLLPDPENDFYRLRREANRTVQIPTAEYKLGMIIRAPLHEQDTPNARRPGGGTSSIATNASEATLAEHYKTESKFGTIFTKYRKMIVVALHQDHYVAIPLYTHNGKGLVNKRQPDEFVSVKDHRYGNEDGFVPLSRWDPLVTESVKDGIDLFDRKSTAHLAYPVSRRYQLPVVLEGCLRSSSYELLVDLFNRFCAVDR